eukprot:scaffold7044_cov216-Pinguiococcus_pyrenoidosus.AAC.11
MEVAHVKHADVGHVEMVFPVVDAVDAALVITIRVIFDAEVNLSHAGKLHQVIVLFRKPSIVMAIRMEGFHGAGRTKYLIVHFVVSKNSNSKSRKGEPRHSAADGSPAELASPAQEARPSPPAALSRTESSPSNKMPAMTICTTSSTSDGKEVFYRVVSRRKTGLRVFHITDPKGFSMVLQFSDIDWNALYDGLQESDSSVCDGVKVLKNKGAPEGLLIAPECFFYDSHTGKLRVAFPWKDRGRNGLVFEFQKSHRGATKTTKARML